MMTGQKRWCKRCHQATLLPVEKVVVHPTSGYLHLLETNIWTACGADARDWERVTDVDQPIVVQPIVITP